MQLVHITTKVVSSDPDHKVCQGHAAGRWGSSGISLSSNKETDSHDIAEILLKVALNTQALVSFKKYMPPPLPYFKVNIFPLPLAHFSSISLAYLWSFRWPNYIVTLPRYFSFRLPHLNINTGPPSDELDKNIQRKSHFLFFSHWNGYNHFRFALDFSYAFGIL